MPDILFKTKEEIPEGLREHAEEKDGAFVVDVAPGKKLKEFRDNNIAIVKERDTHKGENVLWRSKLGDNPEAIAAELLELRGIKQKVDDGKLTGTDKIEAQVATRAKAIEDGYKGQVSEANTKLANTQAKLKDVETRFKRSVIRTEIMNVALATDSGANPEAIADIVASAENDFAVSDEGKLVRMIGDKVEYGADGVTPQSPKEWLAGLLKTKPYFQKPSVGGGALGGRGTGNFGMSDADFQKLPPATRMEIARKQGQR